MDNGEIIEGFICSIMKMQVEMKRPTADALYALGSFQNWCEEHGYMNKTEFGNIWAKVIRESDF